MLFYTIGQGSVFVWMAFAGMMIGLLYDFFRLLRCLFHAGTAVSLLLDCTWGVLSGAVLAVMLVIANRGEMRLYVLLAVLAGFALYWAAASRPMQLLWGAIYGIVKKLPRFRLFDIIFK